MPAFARRFLEFVGRFTLLHVITYSIFGALLFFLGSAQLFISPELQPYLRPADSPIVRAAPLFQIIRGALLAAPLYPFRSVIINGAFGWLKLWALLWVLTGISSAITGPGSIEGFIYTTFGLSNPVIGYPEITLQTLVFSLALYFWERRSSKTTTIQP